MEAPLILLDQDGPLADFDAALHGVLADLGHDPDEFVATEWDYTRDVNRHFGPEAVEALDAARLSAHFFRSLPVTPGAQEGVANLLEAGCRLVVCTAPSLANPTCASDKLWWIERHFPELAERVVITVDKTLVHGDLLLDDKPLVTGAMRPSWSHLRFDSKGTDHLDDGWEIDGWDEWRTIMDLATVGRLAAVA
jgi:5'-nucleotidase